MFSGRCLLLPSFFVLMGLLQPAIRWRLDAARVPPSWKEDADVALAAGKHSMRRRRQDVCDGGTLSTPSFSTDKSGREKGGRASVGGAPLRFRATAKSGLLWDGVAGWYRCEFVFASGRRWKVSLIDVSNPAAVSPTW